MKLEQLFSVSAGILAAAAIGMPSAMAGDTGAGWYTGASLGWTRAKIDDSSINVPLISNGATAVSINQSEHDNGFKVFAGYQFNKNLAIEGGYFDLGSYNFDATTNPAGTLHVNIRNTTGFNLDLVGILPLRDNFSLFGRIGAQDSETKGNASGTGAIVVLVPASSKREFNYKAGLGAQYDFTKVVGVRAEWEHYRISDGFFGKADVDIFSAGLLFRF